jgi:GTP-binding protein
VQFIDEAEIHVKAGDGGAGAVAFRREKFIPRGGPSGGDGGDGADIVLETDERLTTLLDFRFKREYTAKNGEPGRGRDQNGHAAPDLVLKVPPGTLVRSAESGEVLADLRENGLRHVLAKGGRGGLGNMNFATPTLQAPRFAQPGIEGEERQVRLELRLLADVGLVGFPNAGKSTLVSRLSRARPKIADYPFTTLQPHLGVVQYKDGRSFVLTDLPGLIEGAHQGAGLGTRFLKHMQRCRVVIHLIDASAAPIQGRDLLADFDAINRELALFDPALGRKTQVVAANKVDLPEAREAALLLQRALAARGLVLHLISGVTGEGVAGLVDATVLALDQAGPAAPFERDLPRAAEEADGEETFALETVERAGDETGEQAGEETGEQAGEETGERAGDATGEQAEERGAGGPEAGGAAAARSVAAAAAPVAAEEPLDEPGLEDEREEAQAEKQKRAPKLTGRRKDGMLKERAQRSEQPLGNKFRPTSEAAASLLAAAARRAGGGKAKVPAVRDVKAPKARATAKDRGTLAKAKAQAAAAGEKRRAAEAPEPEARAKAKAQASKAKKAAKKKLPPSKVRSAKARRKPTR